MIFLVWYLISSGKLDFRVLKDFLSLNGMIAILIIFVLMTISQILFSKRYQIFLKAMGFTSKLINTFKIVMVGVFYNNFLPGGTGGDLIRIYYIKRQMGVPIPVGTAATILDRVIGLLGLLVVALCSLFWVISKTGSGDSIFHEQTFIIAPVIILPVAIVVGLMLLRFPLFYNIIEKILSKILFGQHMVSFLSTFRTLVSNTKLILLSLTLCICGHIITLTCISIIANMLYGSDVMYAAIAVSGIILITQAVPVTPGNIGMTEWIADRLFGLMGAQGGATVFIVWRAVLLMFSLLGGIIYLRMGKKSISQDIADGIHEQDISDCNCK